MVLGSEENFLFVLNVERISESPIEFSPFGDIDLANMLVVQRVLWHCDDVVTADDTQLRQTLVVIDRNFGPNATRRLGDGSAG